MAIDLNWLVVALAIVAGMVVAMTWYSDWGLFGKAWRPLTGVTEKDSKKAGNTPMVFLLIANTLTAVGLAVAIAVTAAHFENNSVWLALLVGFVAWLTFSATTLLQHNTFELKAPKLTLINNGYQLVLFLGIALVIGLLG
jgi:hypothetical protein